MTIIRQNPEDSSSQSGEQIENNDTDQKYHAELLELAQMRMPFGKYSGRRLVDLPEPYVVWFSQNGFPQGKLGKMLQLVYEIKVNGLEYLFKPLR